MSALSANGTKGHLACVAQSTKTIGNIPQQSLFPEMMTQLLMDNSSAEEDSINIYTVPSMNLSSMTRCTFPLTVIWLVRVERKLSLNETAYTTIMDYVEELGHYFLRQSATLSNTSQVPSTFIIFERRQLTPKQATTGNKENKYF